MEVYRGVPRVRRYLRARKFSGQGKEFQGCNQLLIAAGYNAMQNGGIFGRFDKAITLVDCEETRDLVYVLCEKRHASPTDTAGTS